MIAISSDTAVLDYIRSNHYDVAIVDLIQNECMMSIPVSMGVPVVGFWMTLPLGTYRDGQTRGPKLSHSLSRRISRNLAHFFLAMLTHRALPNRIS